MVTSTKQKQLARKLRSLAKKSQICRGILGEGWLLSLWTKFWSDWPFIYVWQFSSLWMKSLSMTIQVKANEQYLYVELVLTIKYVDGILKCDHSNESHWVVIPCDAVYCAVQGGCNIESVDETLKSVMCGCPSPKVLTVLSRKEHDMQRKERRLYLDRRNFADWSYSTSV